MTFDDRVRYDEKYVTKIVGWLQIAALVVVVVMAVGAFAGWFPSALREKLKADMITTSSAPSTAAIDQAQENQKLEDMLSNAQSDLKDVKGMQLEKRLATLESAQDTVMKLLIGILISVVAMLMDTAHRILKPQRRRADE